MNSEELQQLKDLLSMIDLPDLSAYYKFCFIGIGVILLLWIVNKLIVSIKKPKEYIDDLVVLEIKTELMESPRNDLIKLLTSLHDLFYSTFRSKYFFSISMCVSRSAKNIFLELPRIVYDKISYQLLREFHGKINISKDNLNTLISRSKVQSGFTLEMEKDFIFPISENIELHFENQWSNILNENDWFLIQVLFRPLSTKWHKLIKEFEKYMQKGKDPTKGCFGCSGAFLNVALTFFSGIASIVNFFSNSSRKSLDQREVNPQTKEKIDKVKSKLSQTGFEVATRGIISSGTTDSIGIITDKITEKMKVLNLENSNSIVLSNFYKKVGNDLKNDFVLRYMPINTVDVFNERELVSFLLNMYN